MEKIWPCDDDASERFPLFTRANTGEVFSDAATPLTWSLFGRSVYETAYRDGLYRIGVFTPEDFKPEGECEVVGCFGGYVYINVSLSRVLAVRTPGMTPEAIDQAFFGEHPDVRPHRPQTADENEACTTRMVEWMTSLFSATEVPEIARHRADIDGFVAGRPDLTTLSDRELLDRFRAVVPEMRPVFATHIVNLYSANIVAGLLAQVGAAAGAPELAAKVTAGVGDVDSAQQSFDLWDLSRVVRRSASLTAAFEEGVDGLLDRVRSAGGADAAEFLAGWDAFIANWGFLGPSVWEQRSPTYESNPEIPLSMLDRLRKVPDDDSPHDRAGAMAAEREAAVKEVAARLEGDPATQGQFLAAANAALVFMPAREATKVLCTRLCEEARKTMRELGGRFVDRGLLPRWQDILLLMDDEIERFLDAPPEWLDLIRERAATLATLESKQPPFIFEGATPTLDQFTDRASERAEPAVAGDVLRGLGASPGRHTGVARVIQSLTDQGTLEPGDVLVAPTTDSSWGPLFITAGAVVCQTGAAISHAAIVSRELGIPAVVSVPECTMKIVPGTKVTVDGDTGTVTIH